MTGVSVGLPNEGTKYKVFDEHNVQRVLMGENMVSVLSKQSLQQMADMHITQV